MLKEAIFTMKLEPELRADFIAEAEATVRPASQIMHEAHEMSELRTTTLPLDQ